MMASKYKNSISYDKRDYVIPEDVQNIEDIETEDKICDSPDDVDNDITEISFEIFHSINNMRNQMGVHIFDMKEVLIEELDQYISDLRRKNN